jgi:hypothetical protein
MIATASRFGIACVATLFLATAATAGVDQRNAQRATPGDVDVSGAKEIEGVDVIIKRKPKGQIALRARVEGAKTLTTSLEPGEYSISMSFTDPLPASASGKSYFESRSNTVRVVQRPDLPGAAGTTSWLAFENWPYLYAVTGHAVTRRGETISRTGARVEIEQQIEVAGGGAAEVQITVRRAPTVSGAVVHRP